MVLGKTRMRYLLILCACAVSIPLGAFFWHTAAFNKTQPVIQPPVQATEEHSTSTNAAISSSKAVSADMPIFTASTLAPYDGTNDSLPIYIAFEGNVYDVTPGKEFYKPGSAYNYLAGTDGTSVLQYIGGDIIKRKYKVIGTYKE